MENHFGKYQNNASKWWVWGTWKMTQKFRSLKCDCNSSRMEQFSRWLSWWTDSSKSLSLKFCGNKKWNHFQFPSNFTLSCSMWQCVIGKCVSFGMEPEKINEPVSTYPKHRLKGSLAAGTTKTFPGTTEFERTFAFLQSAWGRLSNWLNICLMRGSIANKCFLFTRQLYLMRHVVNELFR